MKLTTVLSMLLPALCRLQIGGGGGGGDGGARRMEEERQARVTSAINAINGIFNGTPATIGTGQATSWNPGATYYTQDGNQWVAPTRAEQVRVDVGRADNNGDMNGGGWYDFRRDPSMGQWAGDEFRLNPGLTMRTTGGDGDYFDGIYRTVQQYDTDAINKALASGQLFTGTQTVGGGDRQAMYDQQRQAVTDINAQDVNRQFGDASRENRFGLARAGLAGGSADIDSNAELVRRQNEGLIKAGGIGDAAASDLRSQDERTRQSLISMAQSGIDTGQAAQMALTGLDSNASAAASARSGATVGNLFGDLAQAYLMRQQLGGMAQGVNAYGGQSRYGAGNTRQSYGGTPG